MSTYSRSMSTSDGSKSTFTTSMSIRLEMDTIPLQVDSVAISNLYVEKKPQSTGNSITVFNLICIIDGNDQ